MERVPRKKEKKDVRRGRAVLLAVVLLAAAAGAIAGFSKTPEMPQPQRTPDIWLINEEEENIIHLTCKAEGMQAISLVRIGEHMRMQGREGQLLREDVVEEILYAASHIQADTQIGPLAELDARAADFGLETPSLTVTVILQDGSQQNVIFGKTVPQEETEMYYCLKAGVLYTVLAEPVSVLYHDAEYLRAFEQPRLQADLIDRIEMTGQTNMTLQYTKDGFVLEKPYAYPMHKQKEERLLERLERMAFEACLGTPEENDMAALGLDVPCLTVVLTQAPSVIEGITAEGEHVTLDVPERQYTLQLGHETGKSGVYVLWEGMVYKASNFLLGFWKEMTVEELLSETPLNISVDRLQQLTVETPSGKTIYTVEMVEALTAENQIATDEFGQILYDAQVRRDGVLVDAAAFLDWYVQLNRLPYAGRTGENDRVSGECVAAVTVKTDALERTVAFYPCDALHVLVEVDGTAVFFAEKSALSLLEKLP